MASLKHGASMNVITVLPDGLNASSYYGCEDLSDCDVETEDNEKLPCHKVILSAASPVFKAMFGRDSSMREAVSSTVKVREAAPEVVKQLLQLIYSKQAAVSLQHLAELYKLADQYQIKSAMREIEAAVQKQTFTLQDLTTLMPAAAQLGDAAATLRKHLAVKAAGYINGISKQLQITHEWGALEVLTIAMIASQGHVSTHPALMLAASWATAKPSRVQEWPTIQKQFDLHDLTYEELKQYQSNPEQLELPGFGAALFAECMRRMEQDKQRRDDRAHTRYHRGRHSFRRGDDDDDDYEYDD